MAAHPFTNHSEHGTVEAMASEDVRTVSARRRVQDSGWHDDLRRAGLRVTRQRLAVLDAARQNPHSTAERIHEMTRRTLPEITVQSVYTVLNSLTASGLLRRLDLSGSAARYETRVEDNHHHAVCTRCGRIEDVACAVGHPPCMAPDDAHGMTIHVADVVYQGVCADCTAATGRFSSPPPPTGAPLDSRATLRG